jgi:hypothetical protein
MKAPNHTRTAGKRLTSPGLLGVPRASYSPLNVTIFRKLHFANELTGCRIVNFDNLSPIDREL